MEYIMTNIKNPSSPTPVVIVPPDDDKKSENFSDLSAGITVYYPYPGDPTYVAPSPGHNDTFNIPAASLNIVFGLAGNDKINVTETGGSVNYIYSGDFTTQYNTGNDTVNINGGSSLNTNFIFMGSANDTVNIFGLTNNTIMGGAGNDTISALGGGVNLVEVGPGNDSLTLGSGNDHVLYNVPISGNFNSMYNAGGGTDTLSLAFASLAQLNKFVSVVGHNVIDHFGNYDTGTVFNFAQYNSQLGFNLNAKVTNFETLDLDVNPTALPQTTIAYISHNIPPTPFLLVGDAGYLGHTLSLSAMSMVTSSNPNLIAVKPDYSPTAFNPTANEFATFDLTPHGSSSSALLIIYNDGSYAINNAPVLDAVVNANPGLHLNFTYTDGDGHGGHATNTAQINFVFDVIEVVTPVSVPAQTATEGQAFSFNVASMFTHTDTDDTLANHEFIYAITSGPLPAGLTFDASTGIISGTPVEGLAAPVTITATATNVDPANQADTQKSAMNSFSLTVNDVNDASVSGSGAVTLNENSAAISAVPASGIVFTDSENNLAADPNAKVEITLAPTHGTLMDGAMVLSTGSIIPYNDFANLTYTPNAGFSGTDSYTIAVSDKAPSVPSDFAGSATVNITINDVNDASSTGGSVSMSEDPTGTGPGLAFNAGNFNIADTDSAVTSFADVWVNIVSLASLNGTLMLGASPVVAGQNIMYSQLGSLVFQPNAGFDGPASFTFAVTDKLAAGVPDFTGAPVETMNITVNDVNDASVSGTGAVTLTNTGAAVSAVPSSGITFTDADGSLAADPNAVVEITVAPANGVLMDGAQVLSAGDIIPYSDFAGLTYTPNAGFTGSDSYTIEVSDKIGATLISDFAGPATVNFTVNPNISTFNNDLLGPAARTYVGDPSVPTPPDSSPAAIAAVVAAAQAIPDAVLNYVFMLNPTDIVVTDNVPGATDTPQSIHPLPGFVGTHVVFDGRDYTLYNGIVNATGPSSGPSVGPGNAIVVGGTFNDTAHGFDIYTLRGNATGENVIIGGADTGIGQYTIIGDAVGNVLIGGDNTSTGFYSIRETGSNSIAEGGSKTGTGLYRLAIFFGSTASHDVLVGGDSSNTGSYIVADNGSGGFNYLIGGSNNGSSYSVEQIQSTTSGSHDVIVGGTNISGTYFVDTQSSLGFNTLIGGELIGGTYEVRAHDSSNNMLIAGMNDAGNPAASYLLDGFHSGSNNTFSIATGLAAPGAHVFSGVGANNTALFQNDLLGVDARTFMTSGTGAAAVGAAAQAGNLLDYVLGLGSSTGGFGTIRGIDINNIISPVGHDGDILIEANLNAVGLATVQNADFADGGMNYSLYHGINNATGPSSGPAVGSGNVILVGGTFHDTTSSSDNYTLTGSSSGESVVIGGDNTSTVNAEYILQGQAGASNVLIGGAITGGGSYLLFELGNNGIAVGGLNSSASGQYTVETLGNHDVLVGGANNGGLYHVLDDTGSGYNYLIGGSNNGGQYHVTETNDAVGHDVLVGGTNFSDSYVVNNFNSAGNNILIGGDNIGGIFYEVEDGSTNDLLIAGSNNGNEAASYVLRDFLGNDTFSVAVGLAAPGAHVFQGGGSNNTADFQNDLLGADARAFLTSGTGVDAVIADAQAGTLLDYVLGFGSSTGGLGTFSGIDFNNTISPIGHDGDILIAADLTVAGLASIQNADFAGSGMNYSLYNGIDNATTSSVGPVVAPGNAIVVGGTYADADNSATHSYTLTGSASGENVIIGGDNNSTGNPHYFLFGLAGASNVVIGGNNTGAGYYEVNENGNNGIAVGGQNSSTANYDVITHGSNDVIVGGDNNSSSFYTLYDRGGFGGNYLIGGTNNGGEYTLIHTPDFATTVGADVLVGGTNNSLSGEYIIFAAATFTGQEILIAGANASGNTAVQYNMDGGHGMNTFEFNLDTTSASVSAGNHEVYNFNTATDTLEFTGIAGSTGGNTPADLTLLQNDLASATQAGGNTTLTFNGTGAPSLQLDAIAPALTPGHEISDLVAAGVHIIVHP
jgi:hypothetical protein